MNQWCVEYMRENSEWIRYGWEFTTLERAVAFLVKSRSGYVLVEDRLHTAYQWRVRNVETEETIPGEAIQS